MYECIFIGFVVREEVSRWGRWFKSGIVKVIVVVVVVVFVISVLGNFLLVNGLFLGVDFIIF